MKNIFKNLFGSKKAVIHRPGHISLISAFAPMPLFANPEAREKLNEILSSGMNNISRMQQMALRKQEEAINILPNDHESLKKKIKELLQSGERLTVLSVFRVVKSFELRHYVTQLKREGLAIKSEWASAKGKRWKEYWLEK